MKKSKPKDFSCNDLTLTTNSFLLKANLSLFDETVKWSISTEDISFFSDNSEGSICTLCS